MITIPEAPAHTHEGLCERVQVRPLLEAEKQKGGSPCVEVPESCVVQLPAKRGSAEGYRYDFDRVYKMSSPGRQMFAEVVQPLLDRFMQGFNTTVRLLSCHPHTATSRHLLMLCLLA